MGDRPRRTIRRIVIGYIVAFGVLTLASGEATYLYARHAIVRAMDANIGARMAELQRIHASGGLPALARRIDAIKQRGARTFGYSLIDGQGRAIEPFDGMVRMPPGWGQMRFRDGDEAREDPARTLTVVLADGATLTIIGDSDFLEMFDEVTLTFVACALGILLLFAIAGWLALERAVRLRLAALNETALQIFDGNLDRRVPLTGRNDEFDAMATTVNAMLDRMTSLIGEVRRVSRYIAHDLRAPLVRLRERLVRTSTGCADPADCVSDTGDAIEQCDEIIALFGAILRVGDIDRALIAKAAVRVDLSELVADLAEAHEAVAEARGRVLRHAVARGLVVLGDRELLGQVLVNLIDNGLRHTPEGAAVTITLHAEDNIARLTVGDNGPSLTGPERRRLLEDARVASRETPYRDALGLKLVRVIVDAHRGTIALTDAVPGLRFEIGLPLA